MENHINKLTPRLLPLQGKVILLNTLILSKTSYLSNMFPLDPNTTSKIHKIIFKYLWNSSNTEPIARKTIFLKKKHGGLNLIEPESHNFAMRIKHLLKLKQKDNTPPWTGLATYWLSIDIHNFSKEYQFLMSNNRVKTINKRKPFYYQDIIDYIQNHNRHITTSKVETQNIYQKIILKGSKEHKITGEIQWKKLIPNIQFENIWKNTYNSYGQPFQKDLHYRLLHYSTKTNHYMHKCSKENNPNCDYCGLPEDNLHLFTKCSRIQQIWTQY